jgi:hypothetical protein
MVLGFVIEGLLEVTLPRVLHLSSEAVSWSGLALLYVGVWVGIGRVRRRSPSFLATPPAYSAGEAVLPIVVWSFATYVMVGVTSGLMTFLLIPKTDHHWPLIVFGFAVWVPAFFAVPAGAFVAWRRLTREMSLKEHAR